MFKKLKIIFEDNKGYVAVLLAVLIPIIISSFYLYVRYDNIDSEQTALSIATRDAALAAVSNYSTGVTKTKEVEEKVDFDSQKKYILRKAVNAFNSTIVAKRGLGADVIKMNNVVEQYKPISYTEKIHPHEIYAQYFSTTYKYRTADLDNPFGPEYPAYSDIMLRKLGDSSFAEENNERSVDQDEAKDNTPQLSVDERQISITQDPEDQKSLIVTTTIKPKTGDSEIDKNKIITTSYKASPATCNADIILAVPTNHAAFTKGNSIADDIPENYENTPIYAIKHALRRFVKKFMFYDGIRFGVIPYSGKVSVDADNSKFIGKLSTFQYQDEKSVWPSDIPPEIPISNSYYVKGSCGEDVKFNYALTDTFSPVIGIMAHEHFFSADDEKFYKQPVDICYGGDISLYSEKCKKSTKFFPNPFPILPLTKNTYDVFSYLLMLNPYGYADSPDKNFSNFLFLPFSIADLMFKKKYDDGNRIGNGKDQPISGSEENGDGTTRKKIMIMIANQPDFFAPREMTFLGFDNDACHIPMEDGERLNFEEYYKVLDPNDLDSVTLKHEDGYYFNNVREGSELTEYRKKTRITVKRTNQPNYQKDEYTVTLPNPNPVRIAVKSIFTVQVVPDSVHSPIAQKYIKLECGGNAVSDGNCLEIEFKDTEEEEITLTVAQGASLVTPVIAKLKVHGVKLESKTNGYIIAVDDNKRDDSGCVYLCSATGTSLKNGTTIKLGVVPANSAEYPVLSYAVVDTTGYLLSGKNSLSVSCSGKTSYTCRKKYNAKIEAGCKETWTATWTEWTDGKKTINNAPDGNWINNSATTCAKDLTGNCGVASIKISLGDSVEDAQITSIAINEIKCSGARYYVTDKEKNANEISLWLTRTVPRNTGQDSCKEHWISKNAKYLGLDVNKAHVIKGLVQTKSNDWIDAFSGTSKWNNQEVFPWQYSSSNDTYLIYYCATNQTNYRGYVRITKLTVYYKTSTTKTENKTENKSLGCDKHNCTSSHTFCTGDNGRKHEKYMKLINTTENLYQTISIPQSKASVSIGGEVPKVLVQGTRVFFVPKTTDIKEIHIELDGCKLISVESANNLVYMPDETTNKIETFETKLNNLDAVNESIDVENNNNVKTSENEIITYRDNTITIHKDSFDPVDGKLIIKVKRINPTINGNKFTISNLVNRSGNTGDYALAQNSSFSGIGSAPGFVGAKLNYYWCTGYKYKYKPLTLENPFIHYKWDWVFIFYVIVDSYWVSTQRSVSGASGTDCIAAGSHFTANVHYGWVSECYRPLTVKIGDTNVYNTNYCDRIGETHSRTVNIPGTLTARSDQTDTGSHLAKDLTINAEITSGYTSGCRGLRFKYWPSKLGGDFSVLYANITVDDSTITVNGITKMIDKDDETITYVFNENTNGIKIQPNNGIFGINLQNAQVTRITYQGNVPVMYKRKTEPSLHARWINFGAPKDEKSTTRPYVDNSIYDTFGTGSEKSNENGKCSDCIRGCSNCDKSGECITEECINACKFDCGVTEKLDKLKSFGIHDDSSITSACNKIDSFCDIDGLDDPCKEVEACATDTVCKNHSYKTESNWKAAVDNFALSYESILSSMSELGQIKNYSKNEDQYSWGNFSSATPEKIYTIEYAGDDYTEAKAKYEMNLEIYNKMQSEGDSGKQEPAQDGEQSQGDDGGQTKGNTVDLPYKIPDYCMNEDKSNGNLALGDACKQNIEDDLMANKIAYFKLVPGVAPELKALEDAINNLNAAEKNLEEYLAAGNGAYLTYDSKVKDISNTTEFSDAKKETEKYEGDDGVLQYLKYTTTEEIELPVSQQEQVTEPDGTQSGTTGKVTEGVYSGVQTMSGAVTNTMPDGQTQQSQPTQKKTITKILNIYPKNYQGELPTDTSSEDTYTYHTKSDDFISGVLLSNETIIPKTDKSKDYQNAYCRAPKLVQEEELEKEKLIGSVICGNKANDVTFSKGSDISTKSIRVTNGYINPCMGLKETGTLCPSLCTVKMQELNDAVKKAGDALDAAEQELENAYKALQDEFEERLRGLGEISDFPSKDDNATAYAKLKYYGVELSPVEGKENWYNESCEAGVNNPATPRYPIGTKIPICQDKCNTRNNDDGKYYQQALDNYNTVLAHYESFKNTIKLQQQQTEKDEFQYNGTTGYFETLKNMDTNANGFNMALFPEYRTADITVLLENRYDLQKNEIWYSYDMLGHDIKDLKNFNYKAISYLNGLNSFFIPYDTENAKNAFVGPSNGDLVNDDGAWLKIDKHPIRLVYAEFTNPFNRVFAHVLWQNVPKSGDNRKVDNTPTNVLAKSALKLIAGNVMSKIDKVYFIIYNNDQLEYVKAQLQNYNKKITYKTAKNKDELEKVLDEIAKEIEVESPTAERIK